MMTFQSIKRQRQAAVVRKMLPKLFNLRLNRVQLNTPWSHL